MKLPKFESKAEALSYIRANKKEILKAKKSEVKNACEIDEPFKLKPSKVKNGTVKSDNENEIERTIIGNTYYWLDSHDDVHVRGTFTKSINDNSPNFPHRHDHINMVTAKVGIFKSVYEEKISWRDLGVDKDGVTISVFGDTTIKKDYNKSVFTQYKEGVITQHSVGMIYMDILFCSDDESNKEEYAGWLSYIDELGNKEKAIEQGYFFAIKQAKLIEISCVTRGSNELTPTQESKDYDFDSLNELSEKVKEEPTKENFIYFCDQLKALQEGKAVEKTLPTIEKPQGRKNFYLNQI